MTSYRYMRLLLFYDLPAVTKKDRQAYNKFHKWLISNGFVMMQESIYTKLVLNSTAAKSVQDAIRKNSPKEGLIQLMLITEKQFEEIELIIGEVETGTVQSTDRLVIL